MPRARNRSPACVSGCTYIGPSASSSLRGPSETRDICAGSSNMIYNNLLGGSEALRGNGRLERATTPSLTTRSLPLTQQLCAVTEKTEFHAAHTFCIKQYGNCQPFFPLDQIPNQGLLLNKVVHSFIPFPAHGPSFSVLQLLFPRIGGANFCRQARPLLTMQIRRLVHAPLQLAPRQ